MPLQSQTQAAENQHWMDQPGKNLYRLKRQVNGSSVWECHVVGTRDNCDSGWKRIACTCNCRRDTSKLTFVDPSTIKYELAVGQVRISPNGLALFQIVSLNRPAQGYCQAKEIGTRSSEEGDWIKSEHEPQSWPTMSSMEECEIVLEADIVWEE